MIILLGYMGSGKSSVGRYLSENYNLNFCDLDSYIQEHQKSSIADIFKDKGEIYFRKIEHQCLKIILEKNQIDILALGGGTPCYANNMGLINASKSVKSIYLKVNLKVLSQRLFDDRKQRPLISNINDFEQLNDFIRKHLFEREFYYRQADKTIDVSSMGVGDIARLINLL